ncbi:MAG: hypothetical protein AAF500_20375 [Myxococcota bacterium]
MSRTGGDPHVCAVDLECVNLDVFACEPPKRHFDGSPCHVGVVVTLAPFLQIELYPRRRAIALGLPIGLGQLSELLQPESAAFAGGFGAVGFDL